VFVFFFFTHLHKIVSDNLGRHEDEHDGKAVRDVSRSLHDDDRQAEGHPHDAACEGQRGRYWD